MYSASGHAVVPGTVYNRSMPSHTLQRPVAHVHRLALPVEEDASVSPVPSWRTRVPGAVLLAILALVLALTFRAWLQPDLLLELASTVFCS